MGRFVSYNANPDGHNVGDCTVRAISTALGESWEDTYIGLCLHGYMMGDMPSADNVWGSYLRSRGFRRRVIPDECPNGYNVSDFCDDHPEGVYILALSKHVVCVQDGVLLDTWDSRGKIPIYYWMKES